MPGGNLHLVVSTYNNLHEVSDMPTTERWNDRKFACRRLADVDGNLRPNQKGHSVASSGLDMDGHVPTATFRQGDMACKIAGMQRSNGGAQSELS
jgi:hypothetical protein